MKIHLRERLASVLNRLLVGTLRSRDSNAVEDVD